MTPETIAAHLKEEVVDTHCVGVRLHLLSDRWLRTRSETAGL